MSYQITDVHGVTRLMPDHSMMIRIVDEMYNEHTEPFRDVILSHQNGYSISLHPNGCAVLDYAQEEQYYTLTDLTREDQLMLWIQLAANNIKSIKKLDWKSDEASL
jgi:hypothetical protein